MNFKNIRLKTNLLGEEEQEIYHEPITISGLTENQIPTLQTIVSASHFWMSDHARYGFK